MTVAPTSSAIRVQALWSWWRSWTSPSRPQSATYRPCSSSKTWTRGPVRKKATRWKPFTRTASRKGRCPANGGDDASFSRRFQICDSWFQIHVACSPPCLHGFPPGTPSSHSTNTCNLGRPCDELDTCPGCTLPLYQSLAQAVIGDFRKNLVKKQDHPGSLQVNQPTINCKTQSSALIWRLCTGDSTSFTPQFW